MASLTRVLRGVTGDANVKIYGCTPGEYYEALNSSNVVVASGTADAQGVVTLTTGFPVTGYIQGYVSNGGATLTDQRWPSSGTAAMQLGNRFDADLSQINARVLADNASYYYGTSQYGGSHSQIAEDDDYIYACFRTGGRDFWDGSTGDVYVVRFNKALDRVDQGPVLVDTTPDGHETYAIALNPVDGKLRYVGGGYDATSGHKNLVFRETSTAQDITAWTTAANIEPPGGTDHFLGVFKVGPDGRNYIAGSTSVFTNLGDFIIGTSANGSTTFTWTTLANSASSWGSLGADMVLDTSVSPARAWVITGSYYGPGSLSPADENYRRLHFFDVDVVAGTARKADGTSMTLPLNFDASGNLTGGDQIAGGLRYGPWAKINAWQGEPMVLTNGDEAVDGDDSFIALWNGSSWVNRTIADMEAIDLGQGAGLDSTATYGNWGVALTVSEDGSTAYAYSAEIYDNSGTNEMRVIRCASTDGFQSYVVQTLLDGASYVPFSNAELNTGSRPPGSGGSGFCYPKISPLNPGNLVVTADDEAYGTLLLYLAPAEAPAVASTAADDVTTTTASITGTVDPNGVETTYRVEYGETISYGSATSWESAGYGSSPVVVGIPLTGLEPETLYHARIVATSAGGTTNGADITFTTDALPPPDVGLTLDPSNPSWTQIGTDITVRALTGRRTVVTATAYSAGGGPIWGDGDYADRFDINGESIDGMSAIVLEAATLTSLVIGVTPQDGDELLTIRIGIPE